MTDPEQLRNRAATILARLRSTPPAPGHSPHGVDPQQADHAEVAPGDEADGTVAGAAVGEAVVGGQPTVGDSVALAGQVWASDDTSPGSGPEIGASGSTGAGWSEPLDSQAGVRPAGESQMAASEPPLGQTEPIQTLPGQTAPASLQTPDAVSGSSLVPSGASPSHTADGAHRSLPRVLAIANQKGGVGKTTTAVNLGAALAELNYRVLVIDLDPQGNATTGLGINARTLDASIYDVLLHDVPIEDIIEPTSLRNLFVVPATIDLAGAEIELVPVFSRELRLKRAIERLSDDFDFTLIDCPPSLGLLTVNGLAGASEVVVPIQCEYYALEGLGQLLRNVNLVQTNLNPRLEVTTIVLTMYDGRTRLAEQVVADVRRHFGDRVCRNVVPRSVRLSEAPSFGQPIVVFDSSSRGAIAYRELAKEVSGGAPQRVG